MSGVATLKLIVLSRYKTNISASCTWYIITQAIQHRQHRSRFNVVGCSNNNCFGLPGMPGAATLKLIVSSRYKPIFLTVAHGIL